MDRVYLSTFIGDTCAYVAQELWVNFAMKMQDKHLLGVHNQSAQELKESVMTLMSELSFRNL